MKLSDNRLQSHTLPSFMYKLADVYVKKFLENKEVVEFSDFKMKREKIIRSMILTGEYEPATTNLIKKDVKTGMSVLDLGAYAGWFTLLFSRLVGNSGHVYSFEPLPEIFEILKENVKINNLQNVSVFPYAISNSSGKAKFSLNKKQVADSRLNSKSLTKNVFEVDTITLDEFCEKNKIIIDYIKMDVQGSEPKVFEGMQKSISANSKMKIIFEFYPEGIIDTGSSPIEFIDFLEKQGFIIKKIGEGVTENLKPIKREKLLKNKWTSLYCYKP